MNSNVNLIANQLIQLKIQSSDNNDENNLINNLINCFCCKHLRERKNFNNVNSNNNNNNNNRNVSNFFYYELSSKNSFQAQILIIQCHFNFKSRVFSIT
jgi:hypothetical protein